ncbi:Linoleate diol synthase, partial [Fusarium oxysporum f. sp. albedinis]
MAIQQSARLNISNLGERFWNTIRENWYLGFASFGGPPVHFKIVELFTVCQAFSGRGSTKMHYCINLLHDGFLPALFANKWVAIGLPGALGMYGLSIGVSNIGESLPRAVYALLSGLNAATVGIIVLAAVQLSEKAITDKITRILVFLGASAGMMYNALWYLLNVGGFTLNFRIKYFPLLMFLAGVATVVHDFRWLHRPIKVITARFQKKAKHSQNTSEEGVEMQIQRQATASNGHKEFNAGAGPSSHGKDGNRSGRIDENGTLPLTEREASAVEDQSRIVPQERRLNISWKFGVLLIVLFLLSFIVVMVLRGTLPYKSRLYSLFANMYLAGTIIFGGGPVVIPLLREYVVAENWVSPRDFLIGLALIQAFPGPNFNFAVYLGSLTAINGGYNSAAGAILGFLGIFIPGLLTVHGTMGAWSAIRGWRWVKSSLRGVNAAAVGLTYTAVYLYTDSPKHSPH